MGAASARQFMKQHGLTSRVQKHVADAPPLTPTQLEALRHIFMSTNGEAPVQQPAPADDTRRSSSDAATQTP